MIGLLCFLIPALIISLVSYLSINMERKSFTAFFFIGAFGGFVLWAFTGIFVSSVAPLDFVKVDEHGVVVFANSESQNKSYYLGTGHVDDEITYVYMQKTEHGKTLKHVDADSAVIIKSDKKSRIVKYEQMFSSETLRWLLPLPGYECIYKIFVPNKSITHNFTIDLE